MNANKTRLTFLFWISLTLIVASFEVSSQKESRVLRGPYLGQELPGLTPQIFAPGFVATEHRDYSGFFSPDMTSFFFTRRNKDTGKWW